MITQSIPVTAVEYKQPRPPPSVRGQRGDHPLPFLRASRGRCYKHAAPAQAAAEGEGPPAGASQESAQRAPAAPAAAGAAAGGGGAGRIHRRRRDGRRLGRGGRGQPVPRRLGRPGLRGDARGADVVGPAAVPGRAVRRRLPGGPVRLDRGRDRPGRGERPRPTTSSRWRSGSAPSSSGWSRASSRSRSRTRRSPGPPISTFPGLESGERVGRRLTLGERAPILAKDGTAAGRGPGRVARLAAGLGGDRRHRHRRAARYRAAPGGRGLRLSRRPGDRGQRPRAGLQLAPGGEAGRRAAGRPRGNLAARRARSGPRAGCWRRPSSSPGSR